MPPLLLHGDGRCERLTEGGISLGMFEHSTYTTGQVVIATDDLFAVYSDGITEAESQAGVPFDEIGLETALKASRHNTLAEVGASVVRAVERHTDSRKFADDLTILLLRRCTTPAAAGVSTLQRFPAKDLVVIRGPYSRRVARADRRRRARSCARAGRRRRADAARAHRARRARRRRRRVSLALMSEGADRARARDFASTELMPGVNRAVIQERDRSRARRGPGRQRLPVDGGRDGRVRLAGARRHLAARRQAHRRRPAPSSSGRSPTRSGVSSVENIYRVTLNPAEQYAAHDLKIAAEDLDLTLSEGTCLRRRDRGRRHRRGVARQRHAQFSSLAGDRKRPGQDLLRQRDARDRSSTLPTSASTRPTSKRCSPPRR